MITRLLLSLKHIVTPAVLLSTFFATPVQALDCDDQEQLMQQFEAIAQQSRPLDRGEIDQPEDWILEIPEYQALQTCGNAIYPVAVEFTATAALDTTTGGLFDNNRYFVMSAFWLNHADQGLNPLINALNRTESQLEQANLIEAIRIITSQWSDVRFSSLQQYVGEALLPLLDHPDPWTRVLVVRVLTDFAEPALVAPEILIAIQQEPPTPPDEVRAGGPPIRSLMAHALAWSPAAEFVIPEIIELVRTSPDVDVYTTLIPALRLRIDEDHPDLDRALDLLVHMTLHDDRESTALPAVYNLGLMGANAQATIPDLINGFQQVDSDIAVHLVTALVKIGEDLITNINSLTPAEITELAALYERAVQIVRVTVADSQEEKMALSRIRLTFRNASLQLSN